MTMKREDLRDEDSLEEVFCPSCDGPGYLMGGLGMLLWFRCRNCGIEFNREKGAS
jgi:hypothetical protein